MAEWSHILSDDPATSGAPTCVLRERKPCRYSVVWLMLSFLVCFLLLTGCEARGRLVEPPSRASMWRYDFSNPVDFNDDRVDCGGFVRQWRKNQGRCGVCGDPWDLPKPRPHETRGMYGRGVIVHNYTQAQAVVVEAEVTASSDGHFEYRLCPRGSAWTQEAPDCFTHTLKDDLGRSQIPVNVTQKFARVRHVLLLPQEVVCLACILQWKFVTVGRAGRAEYRACADVTISPVTTTETGNVTTTTTDSTTTTTTDADTVTTTNTEETTKSLSVAVTSLPKQFDSPSSHVPESHLGYPYATDKPALTSEAPQTDATLTHTRIGIQNDEELAGGGGNTIVVSRFFALYYGATLLSLVFRCSII